MPAKRGINQKLLEVVAELKEESDDGSNRVFIWAKCYRSLKAHGEMINSKDELLGLLHWGPMTTAQVWRRYQGAQRGVDAGDDDHDDLPSRSPLYLLLSHLMQAEKTLLGPPRGKKASNVIKRKGVPSQAKVAHRRSSSPEGEDFSDIFGMGTHGQIDHAAVYRTVSPAHYPSATAARPDPNPKDLRGFLFTYIDDANQRVSHSSAAYFSMDDGKALFKIEFPRTQANHPWEKAFICQRHCGRDDTYYGFVESHVIDLVEECPGLSPSIPPSIQKQPSSQTQNSAVIPIPQHLRESTQGGPSNRSLQADYARKRSSMQSLDPTRIIPQEALDALAGIGIRQRNLSGVSTSSVDEHLIPESMMVRHRSSTMEQGPANTSARSSPALNNARSFHDPVGPAAQARKGPRASRQMPAPRAVEDTDEHPIYSSSTHNHLRPFEPHVFIPGSYDIFMVLDSREDNQNNLGLVGELERRGVQVQKRPLVIGDVAWIAVRRLRSSGEAVPGPQECVLDYVVERKRMDDLVGSVKDGRFHEQKFRLKQSGIGQVYYLVEHHNTSHHRESFDQMIDTALSSTQVVDGFKVKETANTKATVDFLVTFHKQLAKVHENRTLRVIPTSCIRRHSYVDLQRHLRAQELNPSSVYLTSFDDFQILNDKSGFRTLRDLFARMLLCVNGMTPEKVRGVLDEYDCPVKLWNAFMHAEKEERDDRAAALRVERELEDAIAKGKGRAKKPVIREARMLLTRIEGLTGRKKIGEALSEKVYTLFTAQGRYPSE